MTSKQAAKPKGMSVTGDLALRAALQNLRGEIEKVHADYSAMDRSDLRYFVILIDAALTASSQPPSKEGPTSADAFMERFFAMLEPPLNERERTIASMAVGYAVADVPQDVRRLVIAARVVAFEDQSPEALRELDRASEAFASRVGWDDEPEDPINLQGSGPAPVTPRNHPDEVVEAVVSGFPPRQPAEPTSEQITAAVTRDPDFSRAVEANEPAKIAEAAVRAALTYVGLFAVAEEVLASREVVGNG